MNEQVKNFFEEMRETITAEWVKTYRGKYEAFRTYDFNLDHDCSEFECNELPWTTDMKEFVETMREAGVETIAVTERSTALMENLHKLAKTGCKLGELCTVTRPNLWGEPEEIPAIRIHLN